MSAASRDAWRQETVVYVDHVRALFSPGRKVREHEVATGPVVEVGDLAEWTNDDYDLLIEEGRRTFDSQATRFDRVRTTAQVLLPTAIALLAVLGSELRSVASECSGWARAIEYAVWIIGTLFVVFGGLGAASVLTVRSPFGTLLPTLVSQQEPPIKKGVALSYLPLKKSVP